MDTIRTARNVHLLFNSFARDSSKTFNLFQIFSSVAGRAIARRLSLIRVLIKGNCFLSNLKTSHFTDIFVSRWSLDNTTYGAYSSPVIGSDKYSFINLKAPVNKTLWFGGEAATDEDSYGFAHEAYSGGVAQADQLLACIKDGSKCPVYKQRQQPKTCSSSVKSESFLPFIVTGLLFCFLFVENY